MLMATPQGRSAGYQTPEQVSNQEPRLGGGYYKLLGGGVLQGMFARLVLTGTRMDPYI